MNEERGTLARIRTIIVVTLISAMLWLLAESRMVRTSEIEAQVGLMKAQAAGGIELVVRQSPEEPLLRTIKVELEGSTSGIDRFARAMQNRFDLRLGREIPARPGIFTIDLRAELRKAADLDIHGVTIKSVTPETIMIEVDEIETFSGSWLKARSRRSSRCETAQPARVRSSRSPSRTSGVGCVPHPHRS
jgi:hypothetical protein